MGWDYAWSVGPPGGPFTTLTDVCRFVRLPAETAAPGRWMPGVQPYRHGAAPPARVFSDTHLVLVEFAVRYTDPTGAVTHPDGRAGHFYANLATLRQALAGGRDGRVFLRRTTPDWGPVELDAVLVSGLAPSQERWVMLAGFQTVDPFWRAQTVRTGLTSPFTVLGIAPVPDPVVHVTGGTDVTITHDQTGDKLTIAGATPAGGLTIDVGAGTVLEGSNDRSNLLSPSTPWWLELVPGSNTFTITGAPTSVTFDVRDRWR